MTHLILETDAPYLAPVPHRGKRNEPAYTALVAQKLAECYQKDSDEIIRVTTQNCIDLFKLNLPNHEEDPTAHPDFMDD